ncbi:sodium-independent anion transporter, partial [Acinetobacter guillouiae]|nr:sodium-independent anion transporter [Acinetobacter guillouiae]
LQRMDLTAYLFVAFGFGVVYLFPYIPKIGQLIPSPLVCSIILSFAALFLGADLRTVSDLGKFPDPLPLFLIPDIPL